MMAGFLDGFAFPFTDGGSRPYSWTAWREHRTILGTCAIGMRGSSTRHSRCRLTAAQGKVGSDPDPAAVLSDMGVNLDEVSAWLEEDEGYDSDEQHNAHGLSEDDLFGLLRLPLVEAWLEEDPQTDLYFSEFGKKRRNLVTAMHLEGDPAKKVGDPFKYGEFDVYAFWDLDMMNCESLPVHDMVDRVRAALRQFGRVRDIFGYGNMLVDYRNVETRISQKRDMLRRMMWLPELPPIGKRMRRLFVDKWGRDYEPDFDIHDVDFDEFFKDDSWQNVLLTRKRLKCEFCNRHNFKKLKSLSMHFINTHSYELNDKVQETYPDRPFRKEDWWWNSEARVNQFMVACNAIGLRPGPIGALQIKYYVATLGVKFNKVRPAKRDTLPQRLMTDINTALKRWGAKESSYNPIIALICEERGKLVKTFKEAKRRYPGLKVIVVRKQAWKKPYQFADWNFEWDDMMIGKMEPLDYDRVW